MPSIPWAAALAVVLPAGMATQARPAGAAEATARVAVVDMNTQVGGRALRDHDRRQVQAAAEAVARQAGADLVLESTPVLVIAPATVPDLSRAVAQRLAGTPSAATPVPRPAQAARICVVDANRVGSESRLGRSYQDRLRAMEGNTSERAVSESRALLLEGVKKTMLHVEAAARERGCDVVLTTQGAVPVLPLADLTDESVQRMDGTVPSAPERLDAPTTLSVVDTAQMAESALWRQWAAEGQVEVWQKLAEFVLNLDAVDDVVIDSRGVLFADERLSATATVVAAMDAQARRSAAWADAEALGVRVGGEIKEPAKLKHATPVYPDIAKQARVQGTVILECLIDRQGRVSDVRVLRSIPLLDSAAIEAVRQWEYAPTLLNGVPAPVIVTVTVNFSLS